MAQLQSLSSLPNGSEASMQEVFDGQVPVIWEVPLPPHLDTERMQINLTSLRFMQRTAAFAGSLVKEYIGEVSESHSVVGINPDGSALAGKTKSVHKAQLSRSGYVDQFNFPDRNKPEYGKPVAVHSLNRPEVVDRVIDLKQDGKQTDEGAWAKVLDASLRESMRQGAKRHLIKQGSPINRFMGAATAFNVEWGAQEMAAGQAPIGLCVYVGGHALVSLLDSMIMKIRFGDPMVSERRWSLLPYGMQPDRYAILNAVSRKPGLISVKK
jgi:hypothetical protein